jgi:hypothetical protein
LSQASLAPGKMKALLSEQSSALFTNEMIGLQSKRELSGFPNPSASASKK